MKSFRQFVFEGIEFKKPDMGFGTIPGIQDHPVSVGAKNINHARKGLHDNLEKSRASENDATDFIRVLYDNIAKKFYVWFSIDTVHLDISKFYKVKSSVELYYTPSTKEIKIQINDPMQKRHEKTWIKFFGKNAKYDSHSPNNEIFE